MALVLRLLFAIIVHSSHRQGYRLKQMLGENEHRIHYGFFYIRSKLYPNKFLCYNENLTRHKRIGFHNECQSDGSYLFFRYGPVNSFDVRRVIVDATGDRVLVANGSYGHSCYHLRLLNISNLESKHVLNIWQEFEEKWFSTDHAYYIMDSKSSKRLDCYNGEPHVKMCDRNWKNKSRQLFSLKKKVVEED
eukprot:TRINITY_DN12876_c0_g2_i1.p1 TRINITY_DN12876_c0_g2~~TRINITY_DN12876_c0_g2_i1.p1  ORF type:complete len:213 (+),score=15.35 TRINITY_DN12876_c0_g2_i1:67-639(+)